MFSLHTKIYILSGDLFSKKIGFAHLYIWKIELMFEFIMIYTVCKTKF
jgi:hypothetical protein